MKAPADGIISKTSAEVGQLASIGVSLIGFVDTEERWITANFKETEIEYIKNGESVQIEVDAYTNKTYKGFVYAQSSSTGATFTLLPPDNSTGNFTKVVQRVPVRIHFEKLTEQDIEMLKNGLSAFIKIKKTG
ncbi:efflux RND transporter periplasmic adaptor subunit [Silvanigrella sp.]|uniref:HlyD family secretion protein n=1 Tax=Silvanigrella sp. TaxID=2024976 RepID=UPI0037CAE4DE